MSKSSRVLIVVAVAIAFGLAAPSLLAKKPESQKASNSPTVAQTISTMEIINGLSNPATDESHASPTLPPGQGGTPPGKPEGRGQPDPPPGQGGTPPGKPDDRPPSHARYGQNKKG